MGRKRIGRKQKGLDTDILFQDKLSSIITTTLSRINRKTGNEHGIDPSAQKTLKGIFKSIYKLLIEDIPLNRIKRLRMKKIGVKAVKYSAVHLFGLMSVPRSRRKLIAATTVRRHLQPYGLRIEKEALETIARYVEHVFYLIVYDIFAAKKMRKDMELDKNPRMISSRDIGFTVHISKERYLSPFKKCFIPYAGFFAKRPKTETENL